HAFTRTIHDQESRLHCCLFPGNDYHRLFHCERRGSRQTAGYANDTYYEEGRGRMLLAALREQVLEANLDLVRRELVLSTFGNASGIARDDGLIVIKPSGVPYEAMKPEHLVVTDLQGKVVQGTLRPSSDLPTHAALYRAFPSIGGIAHTHSEYATAWAQARKRQRKTPGCSKLSLVWLTSRLGSIRAPAPSVRRSTIGIF